MTAGHFSRAPVPGARRLVGAFGVGIAFIALCSVATLFYLAQLNEVARHLARDPVPGAAAIAGFAKDFNQYVAIEEGPATGAARDATLAAKAADIARDLRAYDVTITQDDDRQQFGRLTTLWTDYASLHSEPDAVKVADLIDARLTTMIEWNRLEGVRSIQTADSARRTASVTVLSMLVTAIFLLGLAFYFHLALDESREQMQRLAAGLLEAREEERTAIAREIHDTLGQTLTALKMDVSWIGRRLPASATGAADKLGAMVTLIDDTVVTVRRMATDLRPGVLDDLGLAAAVEWQAQDFERRSGITCGYRAALDDAALDPVLSTAVFRIFQESLTNVARHSRASVVAVVLERRGADLVLEVKDDGVGISAADASNARSIGLTGMRERAQLVGGGVAFAGAPGEGTTVRVRVPLAREGRRVSGLRILIVDDHPIVRQGLKQTLADAAGIGEIVEAGTPHEALDRVRQAEWDAVILDIGLPGRGGLDVLKEIKREKPRLPVLILSMHAEDQYAVRSIRAGAAGYLTKGAATDNLIAAVRKITSGGRYISDALAKRLAAELTLDDDRPLHEGLSDREFDVMRSLAAGQTVGEIAIRLSLSVKTVSTYRARVLEKMRMKNNTELMQYVLTNHLLD